MRNQVLSKEVCSSYRNPSATVWIKDLIVTQINTNVPAQEITHHIDDIQQLKAYGSFSKPSHEIGRAHV